MSVPSPSVHQTLPPETNSDIDIVFWSPPVGAASWVEGLSLVARTYICPDVALVLQATDRSVLRWAVHWFEADTVSIGSIQCSWLSRVPHGVSRPSCCPSYVNTLLLLDSRPAKSKPQNPRWHREHIPFCQYKPCPFERLSHATVKGNVVTLHLYVNAAEHVLYPQRTSKRKCFLTFCVVSFHHCEAWHLTSDIRHSCDAALVQRRRGLRPSRRAQLKKLTN